MSVRLVIAASALLSLACSPAPKAAFNPWPKTGASLPASNLFDAGFWKHWGDGQAELASYDFSITRYREPRRGIAVAIFVTETFSAARNVKVDRADPSNPDHFPVLKLNLVEDFQTGVYDYNTMTSAFVALKAANGIADGTPAKVVYSSQEWCGQVFHQLAFGPTAIRETSHSYFDSEGEQDGTLPARAEGISEDSLPFWARQLARPALNPGESRSVPFLPSLQRSRLTHKPLAWTEATLRREAASREVTVPAGRFDAELWTAAIKDGPTVTFFVEKADAHRILKWESSDGEKAELIGVKRMKYWEMNSEKGEAALKELGISGRPRRTT
ncbi:MAG: hypothetical protein EXQ52_16460 [Bryobacterales bacterium]|nr:hypothetical protein [Bryobacterales bacterium]